MAENSKEGKGWKKGQRKEVGETKKMVLRTHKQDISWAAELLSSWSSWSNKFRERIRKEEKEKVRKGWKIIMSTMGERQQRKAK